MRKLRTIVGRFLLASAVGLVPVDHVLAQRAFTEGLSKLACPDGKLLGAGVFSNVCWGCLFPISLAGVTFGGPADDRPSSAHTRAFCACGGDLSQGRLPTVGVSLGFWQPVQVIELVRRPYCFPALGGMQLSGSLETLGGDASVGHSSGMTKLLTKDNTSMYNFHVYTFPLLAMLQIADLPGCLVGGNNDFDLAILGEAFPNWYQDEISFLINPEAMLFANPVAQAALPVDCAAATLNKDPIDRLFWSAGCWGGLYPFTGNANDTNIVRAWSLLSARSLALLGRLGFLTETVGDDAVCRGTPMKVLKKTQYRLQMMFPVPESRGIVSTNTSMVPPAQPVTGAGIAEPLRPEAAPAGALTPSGCCHPIGMSTLVWGDWRSKPGTGEDSLFLLWQWVDCCLGAF